MGKNISEFTAPEWEALPDLDKAIVWAGVYRDLVRARADLISVTPEWRTVRDSIDTAIAAADTARTEYAEKARKK